MATITLEYDARNSVSKKIIDSILSMKEFSVVKNENKLTGEKYNEETIKAMNDAKSGRNIVKPKDSLKFIDECMK
ncbi:MAG: hypothetical protein MJZ34_08515 [Paludibacteraceae bacterium]|nr:hypothetical protein [Paludibacteraceae bacterium]